MMFARQMTPFFGERRINSSAPWPRISSEQQGSQGFITKNSTYQTIKKKKIDKKTKNAHRAYSPHANWFQFQVWAILSTFFVSRCASHALWKRHGASGRRNQQVSIRKISRAILKTNWKYGAYFNYDLGIIPFSRLLPLKATIWSRLK